MSQSSPSTAAAPACVIRTITAGVTSPVSPTRPRSRGSWRWSDGQRKHSRGRATRCRRRGWRCRRLPRRSGSRPAQRNRTVARARSHRRRRRRAGQHRPGAGRRPRGSVARALGRRAAADDVEPDVLGHRRVLPRRAPARGGHGGAGDGGARAVDADRRRQLPLCRGRQHSAAHAVLPGGLRTKAATPSRSGSKRRRSSAARSRIVRRPVTPPRACASGSTPMLAPVERLAAEIAGHEGVEYAGIDPSPAPAGDRSIGAAIESLTGLPFGERLDAAACARSPRRSSRCRVRTCGYCRADAAGARRHGARARAGEAALTASATCCSIRASAAPASMSSRSLATHRSRPRGHRRRCRRAVGTPAEAAVRASVPRARQEGGRARQRSTIRISSTVW